MDICVSPLVTQSAVNVSNQNFPSIALTSYDIWNIDTTVTSDPRFEENFGKIKRLYYEYTC